LRFSKIFKFQKFQKNQKSSDFNKSIQIHLNSFIHSTNKNNEQRKRPYIISFFKFQANVEILSNFKNFKNFKKLKKSSNLQIHSKPFIH